MSSSQPIPTGTAADVRLLSASPPRRASLVATFAASFTDPSPIAQEALARDLSELSESEREDEAEVEEAVDEDAIGDEDGYSAPYLYRRPSGIAFGTARPAMAIGPVDDPPLSKIEKKQSRNEERSLLRDNHILPPKHPVVSKPGLLVNIYKKLFSTKVPRPGPDEEIPDSSTEPTEASPLLHPIDSPTSTAARDRLNSRWDAAVAAGQIKTTWQREAKTLAVYSRSLTLTFLLQYSISITSIFVVGRIGKLELGAVSLATMTGNITFWTPVQGLATGLDTLCAQAFGSGHKTLVGLQVQRMMCFLFVLCLPLAVVWLNATEILAQILPDRESAVLAGRYLRVLILGMPPFIIFECGKRFVQAQGLFAANTYVLFIAAPLNIFLNWLFVWRLGWGFIGAPIAVVCTQWIMPTLLILYIIFIDGSQCWGGFSKRVVSNWLPMIQLALPSMIMIQAEYFAFEILTLAASRIGVTELAAQSVLVTITTTTYQIAFPVSVAASTRIANLIGAKLPKAAKTCARVTFVAGCIISVFNLALVGGLRYQLPLLFTNDRDVINVVATAMPVCAVMQVFDAQCAVAHGCLRGLGRQQIGGYVNIPAYYIVALPISFTTAFTLGWGLSGLWFGVTIGLLLVSTVEFWYLVQFDWTLAVAEAERRNASG